MSKSESESERERERERVCTSWGRGRGRGRSRLPAEEGATWGSMPGRWDHDLNRRQTPNQLNHPGAPYLGCLLKLLLFLSLPASVGWAREVGSEPLGRQGSTSWTGGLAGLRDISRTQVM